MNGFDESALDPRALRLLLAVLETGSFTRAAQHLGLTQSAVSHGVQRLREVLGDPLFVKSGRGIVPTARALSLAEPARELLAALQRLAHAQAFDPARWQAEITIAANDLQRDVLVPPLLARLRTAAPGVTLRIIPSGAPTPELLRDRHAHLLLTPRPPQVHDLLQRRVFVDRWVVYHDPTQRPAPTNLQEYLAAEHATVVYEPRRTLALDDALLRRGVQRRIRVTVPGFAGLGALLRGSDLLATAPARLAHHLLAGLAWVEPPLPCPPLPMYLVWHRRDHDDPALRWLRAQLVAVAAAVTD
ncbi:MAG: LysR family transcriptional regulator [Tepidimonas ignava]|uniref:DNA-binding transcriptional LysR family regulator n=1 Tax=Tepidimonas ignava TaxID=114249 RepID=A0A4R3L3U5_9BURK|nr:LysR family transcriptional regulator [Tepidimonas ignava]TCS94401.1 DNA-binding transcriptional LysR family regulator [Tepidimonas ignava]TSE19120.1 Nodulation protein D 2 [Tepidimonas ignava]